MTAEHVKANVDNWAWRQGSFVDKFVLWDWPLAAAIAVLGFCLIWWGVNLEADP